MSCRESAAVVCRARSLPAQPARAANKEHLQLMAEIRMLQEQNQQLQALLGTLQDTLKTVTTKIDEQSAATRKAMADQTLAVNNIGDNVRVAAREDGRDQRPDLDRVAGDRRAARRRSSSQPAPQCRRHVRRPSPIRAGGPPTAPPPTPPTPCRGVAAADVRGELRRLHRRPLRPGDPGVPGLHPGVPAAAEGGRRAVQHRHVVLQPEQVGRGARRVPEDDQRLPAGARNACPTRTTSSARPSSA